MTEIVNCMQYAYAVIFSADVFNDHSVCHSRLLVLLRSRKGCEALGAACLYVCLYVCPLGDVEKNICLHIQIKRNFLRSYGRGSVLL